MGAVDAPIDPPAIPNLHELHRRLAQAGLGNPSERQEAYGQLSAVLQFLHEHGFRLGETAPMWVLLDELDALDDGQAGPITAPTTDQKPTTGLAWTRAVVLAIVEAGTSGGSQMAPILARLLGGSGLEVRPADIANWRTLRDDIQSARKRGDVTCERAFNVDAYDAAMARLASDPDSESDLLDRLGLIGKQTERRQPRKIKDGGR